MLELWALISLERNQSVQMSYTCVLELWALISLERNQSVQMFLNQTANFNKSDLSFVFHSVSLDCRGVLSVIKI